MSKLNPLHTPEMIERVISTTGEYFDSKRGSGRSTALALRYISDAIGHPRVPIRIMDHHDSVLYIGHVFRTMLRLYQMPYSKEWDTVLNELLDALEKGKASAEIRNHCLRFSFEKEAYDVWVANRWYAYGNLYAKHKANVHWSNGIPREYQCRPKFSTMIRLNDVCRNLESVHHEVKINQFYDSIRENLK